MSKFEQVIKQYKKTFTETLKRKDVNEDLLRAIAKSLEPSIYNIDSAKVACSKKEERDLIRDNFLIGELGLTDLAELDAAIKETCVVMGSSNRYKYRVVFYYLLVEKFGKESIFITATSEASKEKPKAKKKASKKVEEPIVIEEKKKDKREESKEGEKQTYTPKESSYDIINKYAFGAGFAGFVPIPLLDLASIAGVQYSMIKRLAQNYDHVVFDDKKTKSAVAAIMGGLTSFELGLIARIMSKGIPLVGPIIGGTAMAGFAVTSTRLIGNLFDDHFANGADLSINNVTLEKMKDAFTWEMKRSQPK